MSLPMAVSMIRIRSDETTRRDYAYSSMKVGNQRTAIYLDGYLISKNGLCISCNDRTCIMKMICIRHDNDQLK
jgi:hypothetical protein